MSTPFEIFKELLLEVAGDVLAQRGYHLQDDAIQIRSGLYRFAKALEGDTWAFVDVQLLFYAEGGASRLGVNVWRTDRPKEKVGLGAWMHDQHIETLADSLGWWEFVSGRELEEALQDAMRGLQTMTLE